MTLTTDVRINWPVPAVKLLDHVTVVAGGDPATVERRTTSDSVRNRAAQGLLTLAGVRWTEKPETFFDWEDEDLGIDGPFPPALVVLSIDNPIGCGEENRGRWVQANRILPAVVEWLDDQCVPRTHWWWEDETAGTWHPGTCDVRLLDADEALRELWVPAGVEEKNDGREA